MPRLTHEARERIAERILATSGAIFEALSRPYAAVMDAEWLDVGTRCRVAGPIRRAQMTINGAACTIASLVEGEAVALDWMVLDRYVRLYVSGSNPSGWEPPLDSVAGDVSPWEEL